MTLLIGTSDGVRLTRASGPPVRADGLEGRHVRALRRADGGWLAGADTGVFRSRDHGRRWQLCGAGGLTVWDLAVSPHDPRVVYAGTQPPRLFVSHDAGDSWTEQEAIRAAPGAERWGLPGSTLGARARTIVLDRSDPARLWVGLEVGGILASTDGGASFRASLPGGNPDIHVMVQDPGRAGALYATTGFGRVHDPEPMERRVAGLFGSEDGGHAWRYLWQGVEPPYTRPMCIDPRPPHALTVGAAPNAFVSHRDPGGARSMLYQSLDGGRAWRSLGDPAHSPSATNILSVTPDPETPGGVLVGTDAGEVWRVNPGRPWALVASGLPEVEVVLFLG
jgi:hypothetical protein